MKRAWGKLGRAETSLSPLLLSSTSDFQEVLLLIKWPVRMGTACFLGNRPVWQHFCKMRWCWAPGCFPRAGSCGWGCHPWLGTPSMARGWRGAGAGSAWLSPPRWLHSPNTLHVPGYKYVDFNCWCEEVRFRENWGDWSLPAVPAKAHASIWKGWLSRVIWNTTHFSLSLLPAEEQQVILQSWKL